jgi:hypothetical protein
MNMNKPIARAIFNSLGVLATGALIGLLVKGLLDFAVTSGVNIPQKDLQTDYGLAIVWAMTLGIFIMMWPVPFRDRKALLWIWLAKSLVTLGFMLFYEANYITLDAYLYFSNSTGDNISPGKFSSGLGTQIITAIAWLHNKVLPDSYHILKVSFSMVGLVAVYIFYRSAVMFLRRENILLLYGLGLFPSILFWSSILGKDPVVLLGISLYAYGAVGWYCFKRVRYIFVLAVGVTVAIFIRLWLGPILLFPLAIFILSSVRGIFLRVIFATFLILAFLFLTGQFMDEFALDSVNDLLETTTKLSSSFSHGGSAQEVGFEFTGISSMIAFMPLGAFTALFRPLPGEVHNFFGLLAGLENLLLLILLFLAVIRVRWHKLREPLIIWAILLIIIWASAYGFVSYQNLGTAVRYKLQILPILLGLLLYFSRPLSKTSATVTPWKIET